VADLKMKIGNMYALPNFIFFENQVMGFLCSSIRILGFFAVFCLYLLLD